MANIDKITVNGTTYNITDTTSGYLTSVDADDVTYDDVTHQTQLGSNVGDALAELDAYKADSSHTHGYITTAGDCTTNATIASGDRIMINDESASRIKNSSITFGSSTTTFLANDGTWQTPSGGATIYWGSTAPLSTLGEEGDLYVRIN